MVNTQREAVRRSDLTGLERRTALAHATDAWLSEVFDSALARLGIDPAGVCLAATGSYARGELSERSDLDLVLLHTSTPSINDLAEALWYPIWDARISLDHSVRTPAETRLTAHSDIRVALGAMEMRAVAGNRDVVASTRGAVVADWRAHALRRAPELRALVAARRERAGDLAQRIEPDLKDSYGGIREATVIRALASSWLVDIPHITWDDSLSFLLDVRDVLHRHGLGDRLVLQSQEDVAAALGLADADSLLRSVYLAARQIAYVSDQAWLRLDRLERRSATRRAFQRAPRRTPIANGLVVSDGEIHIARDVEVSTDPGLVLRAAAASAQHHYPLSEAMVTRCAAEAIFPETWSPEMLGSFISLLGAGPGTVDAIEALDQGGILARVIPEWEVIRSAPQRDPVHTFTVDRHLVMTAVHASQYTRDVHRPDLLLIGSLLHDIGKARGGDHSIVGAALAPAMCARMGLNEHDTAVITAMVRWHLLLPETAFRYDIADPSTWRAVRERVPDPETLELLLYLALADQKATGPSVATEWREQLLRQLVAHVSGGVETDEAIPEPSADQREVLGVPGVVVTSRPEADGLLVTVGAPDRVGLLATVAGVLAAHRLEIRSARVVTVGDAAAQDWHVRPFFGEAPDPGLIADDIRRVLDGSTHLDDWLARRATPDRRSDVVPPRVLVSHAPETHTRLEVRAHDEPGLLHRIARIISDHGSVIRGAVVTTAGSEAVDSFFVVDSWGRPLEPDQAQILTAAIIRGLMAPPDGTSA